MASALSVDVQDVAIVDIIVANRRRMQPAQYVEWVRVDFKVVTNQNAAPNLYHVNFTSRLAAGVLETGFVVPGLDNIQLLSSKISTSSVLNALSAVPIYAQSQASSALSTSVHDYTDIMSRIENMLNSSEHLCVQ